MTTNQIANKINGRNFEIGLTPTEERIAAENGIVVAYPCSEFEVTFKGMICKTIDVREFTMFEPLIKHTYYAYNAYSDYEETLNHIQIVSYIKDKALFYLTDYNKEKEDYERYCLGVALKM